MNPSNKSYKRNNNNTVYECSNNYTFNDNIVNEHNFNFQNKLINEEVYQTNINNDNSKENKNNNILLKSGKLDFNTLDKNQFYKENSQSSNRNKYNNNNYNYENIYDKDENKEDNDNPSGYIRVLNPLNSNIKKLEYKYIDNNDQN